MRRVLAVAALALLILGSVVPASSAQTEIVGYNFAGRGSARALDLGIPALRMQPTLANAFKGLTVGLTVVEFSSSPQTAGFAAAQCELVGPATAGGGLPCSGNSMQSSASDGNTGSGKPSCVNTLNVVQVIGLNTACGQSSSRTDSGVPVGFNQAGVAQLKLGLDLSGLHPQVEATKDQVVDSLTGVVDTLLISQIPAAQREALKDALHQALDSIKDGGQAGVIQVGLSTTQVGGTPDEVTVTAQAAGASIGLLGLNNALTDGLVIIEVSSAKAIASWSNTSGAGSASVNPAVATVKVRDLVDLVPGDYIERSVTAQELNNIFANLENTPLATTVELSPATAPQTGQSVAASTAGVRIHALKGLGESAAGARDGGLILRLAAADVAVSGAPITREAPPLPITGGTPMAFWGAAAVLALGAPVLYMMSRRLRNPA